MNPALRHATDPIATRSSNGLEDVRPVLVLGAGAIGCYLGGCLQAAGVPVVFVGRPRVLAALREHGLTLSDLDQHHQHLAASALNLHDAVPAGLAPTLVLLAVKSGATTEAAALLARALPAGTPVVSMQNGIGNADLARTAAPGLRWLAGMVPFNVAELAPGHFHRGTPGALAAQDDAALRALAPDFERAGLGLRLHADLRAVQWGKLLLNLNNLAIIGCSHQHRLVLPAHTPGQCGQQHSVRYHGQAQRPQ